MAGGSRKEKVQVARSDVVDFAHCDSTVLSDGPEIVIREGDGAREGLKGIST